MKGYFDSIEEEVPRTAAHNRAVGGAVTASISMAVPRISGCPVCRWSSLPPTPRPCCPAPAASASVLMITHDPEEVKEYTDRNIHLVRNQKLPWRCFNVHEKDGEEHKHD